METLGTLGGEEEISVSDLDSGPSGMILWIKYKHPLDCWPVNSCWLQLRSKIRNCDSSDSSCLRSSFFTFSTASVFWGLSWSRLSRNWMSGILVSTLFVWSALLRNLRWLRRRITYSSRLQSPRGLFDKIEGLGKGNQIINVIIWFAILLYSNEIGVKACEMFVKFENQFLLGFQPFNPAKIVILEKYGR